MNTPPAQPVVPAPDVNGTPGGTAKPHAATPSAGDFQTEDGSASFAPGMNGCPAGRIGDFTVLGVLGEGGMGTVYLAEDTRLKRKAAIKTMKADLAARPENRERFLREAQAAAAIEHDNVVPIWTVGEGADGSPFIAMPFLQGEMLEARLRREPLQPLGIILKVAREVADGLAAAHARGLIHRDIKPSNVWVEGDPASKELGQQARRCKILDFGLARSQGMAEANLTAVGTVLGTPAYMPPEQAAGEGVDHRADLFSLGVMLYRMSTGKLPFEGPNVMAVLTALATVTPPPARSRNPNLPQALSDLIGRLMSKDPTRRPQSAAEVASAVRQIVKDLQSRNTAPPLATAVAPVASAPDANPWADITEYQSAPTPAMPKPKRSRVPLVAAVALLVLVPSGLWLLGVVVRVETDKGTLVVEISDPETEARVRGGRLILSGADGKDLYTLGPSDRTKRFEAGPYKIRVEGADGLELDTPVFTLKKGGRVTVRVTIAPPAAVKEADPDRKAAEYVLSIGGAVQVNDEDQWIKAAADLPQQTLRHTGVELLNNTQVSDAGLAHFKDCKNLTYLGLQNTPVTDAGLAHFKNCKNLTGLTLQGTKVGDAGLAYFGDCKNLAYLNLTQTEVSDAGLVLFKNCKNLAILGLIGTNVSDAGLVHFKDCKKLTVLGLANRNVSEAGLAHFKDLKNLTQLILTGIQASEAGLAHFKGCKNLTILHVEGPLMSDTGLAHFKDFKNLTQLSLSGTNVSDAGLAHFKDFKNLTQLILEEVKVGDGGLAHFKDCKNLTYLGLKGTQVSDAGLAHFKDCKGLTHLGLSDNQVSDAGMGHLKDFKSLTNLGLTGTKVGDAGMAHLKECKSLTHINLQKTKVTAAKVEELRKALPACKIEWDGGVIQPTDPDRKAAGYVLSIGGAVKVNEEDREIKAAADLPRESLRLTWVALHGNKKVSDMGLVVFKDCKHLMCLDLHLTSVSDAGLTHFKDCKSLVYLRLGQTQVSDIGLAHFKACKNLAELELVHTAVGDAGLAHFKDCKNMTTLNLHGTRVSDAGMAHFKDCNLIRLYLGTTKVSDAGLAHFKDCKNLLNLSLAGTNVGDVGLAHFKDCKNLSGLILNGTQVSDAGLAHFTGNKTIGELHLNNTKVGDAGLAHFKDCKGLWKVDLGSTRVSDAGLAHLKECKNLTNLYLAGTEVTDAGLVHFEGSKNLTILGLGGTKVGDAGLVYFKECKNLTVLDLQGTKVGNAGLAHLKDCKNLTHIILLKTKVTAAKVEELRKALPACKIEWDGGVIEPKQK